MQNAARIFAEKMYEICKPGMIFFEAAQLMRLQQKKRGLYSGKQRRTKDQNSDGAQHNGQSKGTHLFGTKSRAPCMASGARRTEQGKQRPSQELVVRGLLIL